MHQAAMDFVRAVMDRHAGPEWRKGRVIEVGAMYGHDTRAIGLVRTDIFPESAEYVGIDVRPGPGVDVVVPRAHQWMSEQIRAGRSFDVLMATEVFEHDPFWQETVVSGLSLLRPGGLFVMTWATRAREPHEHGMSPKPGWYAGIDHRDMAGVVMKVAREAHFFTASGGEDAQAWGYR